MADQEKTTIAVSQRGISLSTIDDMFRFAKCVAASRISLRRAWTRRKRFSSRSNTDSKLASHRWLRCSRSRASMAGPLCGATHYSQCAWLRHPSITVYSMSISKAKAKSPR
ncbi:MAG: hypothetical protein KatS3mg038_1481 [Candidatus Kapaibacterium sp.]|nr:MAG: hypothetical protein KatS3mg038_1481 [Candidatus Kapabacteria bacterium]